MVVHAYYRLPVRRHKGGGLLMQLLEYLAFLILAFFKLCFLHAQKRYGTVQIHNLPDFLVFAGLGPKLTGARLILDLHDLMPEFFASKFNSGMQSWPVRLVIWQEQLSCRFADHVITVTEVWKGTLIERGVPAEKVSVVMNVADPRIFQRAVNGQRPLPNGQGFHLIYHGT
ncbi:MAG: glycosyltransferase, partial [Anaerolineae bacterium]